ncbi:hypothetical protein JTE90_014250 [Oedothorax gibbosus]|uniref:Uncharacterized protein n=1 Tax=Oedothorax gibbosus TaxID=931172 RepID=A0AAV6UDE7_9ARAC|nr:hypothetical protein JTE90_014250 [Oedothorax gibbosus]
MLETPECVEGKAMSVSKAISCSTNLAEDVNSPCDQSFSHRFKTTSTKSTVTDVVATFKDMERRGPPKGFYSSHLGRFIRFKA